MAILTFHGAAGTVTGSRQLLKAGADQLLVDCGLFQGLKILRERNWAPPPFDPRSVRWVVLTHAHIDHSGWLPRFHKAGFRGTVLTTSATAALLEILLLDSAKLQEEDAAYLNKRKATRHDPALPLYDTGDAKGALELVRRIPYTTWNDLSPNLSFRFAKAGHLLGSGTVEVRLVEEGFSVLFGGDVGRYDMPLNADPDPPPPVDFLVMECTYGDRKHVPGSVHDQLAAVAQRTFARGGILLIPSFAVGRAQQIILVLRELCSAGRLPPVPIHLDSPMAVDATDIYCRYPDEHPVALERLIGKECVLDGPNVFLHRTQAQSRSLNSLQGPGVIISASGMLSGGRVLHHLAWILPDPRHTVLLVGYQPAGTRGRALVEGARSLRFHAQTVPVAAEVAQIHGLSGHADADELFRWTGALPRPRSVFLTHGEPPAAAALANRLRAERGWVTFVPALHQAYELRSEGAAEIA